jgi:hypothetical protein
MAGPFVILRKRTFLSVRNRTSVIIALKRRFVACGKLRLDLWRAQPDCKERIMPLDILVALKCHSSVSLRSRAAHALRLA